MPLGSRAIDASFDYAKGRQTYTGELDYYVGFLDRLKRNSPYRKLNHLASMKRLNPDQQHCMKQLRKMAQRIKKGEIVTAKLMSKPGVGKSVIIRAFSRYLDQLKISHKISCYCGSAALQLKAHSLYGLVGFHSCLLPMESLVELPISKRTREDIKDVRLLILDECSQVGGKLLGAVIKRIQRIKNTTEKPISFFFVGDDKQLNPIGMVPIYSPILPHYDPLTKLGMEYFHNTDYNLILTKVERQKGDEVFLELLDAMREWTIEKKHIDILSQRLVENISPADAQQFTTAIHLCATNELVNERNTSYVETLNVPVTEIKPLCRPFCEICVSSYKTFYFGENLRVTLTRNKVFARSIVNGCEGSLIGCFFDKKDKQFPRFLTLKIDGYVGPKLPDGSIPLAPSQDVVWCAHLNKKLSIKTFDVCLNYGTTIFRSQSKTLPRCVINLTGVGNQSRLTYVAFSRVKSLRDLMIIAPKPLEYYFLKCQ